MADNSGMKTGVYAIVNLLNGNAYIGSASKSFESRFKRHLKELSDGSHHSHRLQAAWNKYGADAFEFAPVQFARPDDVIGVEQIYIDTWRPAYNICPNAGSQIGHKRSEEFKAKQRATFSTPESIARRSAATKKSWADPEARARRIEALRAASKSQETQAKRSASLRKVFATEESKARRSLIAKEVNARPEVKAKIAASSARMWTDPEYVETWRAAHGKPEVRAVMSAKAKARVRK